MIIAVAGSASARRFNDTLDTLGNVTTVICNPASLAAFVARQRGIKVIPVRFRPMPHPELVMVFGNHPAVHAHALQLGIPTLEVSP